MTRNLYLGADLAPAIGAPEPRSVRRRDRPDPARSHRQRLPDPGQGPGPGDPRQRSPTWSGCRRSPSGAPARPAWPRCSAANRPRPRSATTTCAELLDELNKGKTAVRSRRRPERVRPRGARRRERRRRRRARPGDRQRRDQRPADDARRDPRPARRRRADLEPAVGQLQDPAGGADPRQAADDQTRLDATDAKVRGSDSFHFVNTHLEAFDPAALVPSIRALQAGELVAPGGPATSSLPVVLVGDLNSDDDTGRARRRAGLRSAASKRACVERSTDDPLGCCLDSSLLAEGAGGSVADFDHQVDHVMTNDPADITLQRLRGDRPAAGQRLLGLRPRRPLQLPAVRPLASEVDGPETSTMRRTFRPVGRLFSLRRRWRRRIRRLPWSAPR